MICKRHNYYYKEFCWFCFCNYLKKPHDFAYHTGYDHRLLDEFLKKHPNGRMEASKDE